MMRLLFMLCLVLLGGAPAAAEVAVPPLAERVTDLTATLSPAAKAGIEARLADLERRKGSQLAVLVVPTTGEETIEQYGIRVAEAWRLGRKGVDDGLLLLVAKDDRTLRIEVGYGLEGAIPDAVAKRVIDEFIVPSLRAGDFEGGIAAGVDRLVALVDGEPLPEPPAAAAGPDDLEGMIPLAMMFVFVVGRILRTLFGALPGAAIAGGAAFFGAWLLTGSVLAALIITVVVFFLTLAGLAGGTGRGGGWSGGGSHSGGGGFSGGGGGFGGGGASGRW
jgi:uncharacterized protein